MLSGLVATLQQECAKNISLPQPEKLTDKLKSFFNALMMIFCRTIAPKKHDLGTNVLPLAVFYTHIQQEISKGQLKNFLS